MKEYVAQPADTGTRLDVVIASLYPEYTRSALELLFDKELVKVNDKPGKAAYKVRPRDNILIDERLLKQKPPTMNLPIIYEDTDVIVIDKPAGILTHSKGALNLEATVASFIEAKIDDKSLTGNRAGIVHRLDRGTSGIIITAKNSQTQNWLQKQFSLRKTKKTYIAIVEGVPNPPEAIIDAPIARNPNKPQTFSVMPTGKPARTKYKIIKQIEKNGKNYSELELEPQTGRTHQLRVHLAYIGHPIVGDSVYGHSGNYIFLHAAALELTLPSKVRKIFKSKLPKVFTEFLSDD